MLQLLSLPSIRQILDMDSFKQSKRISVYLSLTHEVNTQEILSEMFRLGKEVSHLQHTFLSNKNEKSERKKIEDVHKYIAYE